MGRVFIALRSYGFGSQRTIPGLDGLRAISILLVFISHLTGTRNFPNIPAFLELGEFGVRIFFVISGFLITSLLLKELNRNGSISLPRFFLRRTLRLFPASYFFIGVMAVCVALGMIQTKPWDFTYALTYLMNYHEGKGWSLGHLWSLAIEEQFYLLWPLALGMFGRIRSSRGLWGLVLVTPLLRLTSMYVEPAFNFLVWSDALAIGCLLALLRDSLIANRNYAKLLASRWLFLVPVVAIAAIYTPSTKLSWLVSETVMNVAIAVCIDWTMRNTDGRIGRFLNLPLVSFIGVLSYSLYLWQQPFINRWWDSPYSAFPLNIVLAVTMALVSYLLIEVPFLRLRSVIERKLYPKSTDKTS